MTDGIEKAFDGDQLAKMIAWTLCDRGYREDMVVALMQSEEWFPSWDYFARDFVDPLDDELAERVLAESEPGLPS